MGKARAWRSHCPISRALDILGDRWSLLILRDAMFSGADSFRDFAASDEGIATNVLTDRLEGLLAQGILSARPDPRDGRRRLYHLTDKGWGLAPAIMEIVVWSAGHHVTAAAPEVVAAIRADRDGFIVGLRAAASARASAIPQQTLFPKPEPWTKTRRAP